MPYTIDSNSQEKNWYKFYRVIYTQKQTFLKNQMKSSVIYHSPIIPVLPAAHRLVFPDPTNGGTVSGFHPFSAPIYRPIPAGIFRKYNMNDYFESDEIAFHLARKKTQFLFFDFKLRPCFRFLQVFILFGSAEKFQRGINRVLLVFVYR